MSSNVFLPYFVLFAILVSCKKDKASQNEGQLFKRTKSTSIAGSKVDSFIYDNENRLIQIKSVDGQDYDKRVEYDASGTISKVTYSFQSSDKYSFTFLRNTSGQIVKKIATPSPGFNFAYNQSYTYNSGGQLASDTTYYKQSDSILYYYSFKYDNKGNIIEDHFMNLADVNNQGKTTYTYDSNRNPFFLQNMNNYFVSNIHTYLSRNNIIEQRPWWGPLIKNQITYQSNQLPNKIISENPNGPNGSFYITTLFEYW